MPSLSLSLVGGSATINGLVVTNQNACTVTTNPPIKLQRYYFEITFASSGYKHLRFNSKNNMINIVIGTRVVGTVGFDVDHIEKKIYYYLNNSLNSVVSYTYNEIPQLWIYMNENSHTTFNFGETSFIYGSPHNFPGAAVDIKCLIQSDEDIYTYSNNSWIKIGESPATKNMFIDYGIDLEILNQNNEFGKNIIYDFEKDNMELLVWSQYEFNNIRITANPFPQLILSKEDFLIHGELNRFILSLNKNPDTSNEKIIVSIDGGISWMSHYNNKWESININNFEEILAKGMTSDYFNFLTLTEWSKLGNVNQIRFGFYLEINNTQEELNIDSLNVNEIVNLETPRFSSLIITYDELDKKYSGLMFMDTSQQYYSTSFGEILKYLDFGTLIQGQTSLDVKVYLTNTLPFDVKNIRIYPEHNIDGLTVELSKSNLPFIAEDELFYDQVLGFDEVIEFYVRLTTDKDKVGSGTFDIKVKADVVD